MGDDPRLLMKAFRNVAEARGGISELARRANLDRVALSRTLAGQRNPRLDTLAKGIICEVYIGRGVDANRL